MSRTTTLWICWILAAVLLCSCLMLYEQTLKTEENLPALSVLMEMDAKKADARVTGYMEYQLLDAWGKPDHSDADKLIWRLPDGTVTAYADSQGKIVFCGCRHSDAIPSLQETAALTEAELYSRIQGRFADQLSGIWEDPDEQGLEKLTWLLPQDSPHSAVIVQVDPWGMIADAHFED